MSDEPGLAGPPPAQGHPEPRLIVTRRLLLRQPTPHDIPALIRGLADWRVASRLGPIPYPYCALHARKWLKWRAAAIATGEHLSYVITRRQRPLLVIGGIGCYGLSSRHPMIGYWLALPYWRCGIMREALAAVLATLFRLAPDARPDAAVLPDNVASIALLTGAGFVRRPGLSSHFNGARRRKVAVVLFSHPGPAAIPEPEAGPSA